MFAPPRNGGDFGLDARSRAAQAFLAYEASTSSGHDASSWKDWSIVERTRFRERTRAFLLCFAALCSACQRSASAIGVGRRTSTGSANSARQPTESSPDTAAPAASAWQRSGGLPTIATASSAVSSIATALTGDRTTERGCRIRLRPGASTSEQLQEGIRSCAHGLSSRGTPIRWTTDDERGFGLTLTPNRCVQVALAADSPDRPAQASVRDAVGTRLAASTGTFFWMLPEDGPLCAPAGTTLHVELVSTTASKVTGLATQLEPD
jgi:hypothetical protein